MSNGTLTRTSLILTAVLLLASACQPVDPVITESVTTPVNSASPSSANTPTAPPSATPTTPPTAAPTRPQPTPVPTPDPLETAADIFGGFLIDVQRTQSPDQGRCTWERLTAFPQTEEAYVRYGGQFYTRVEVKCIRDVEVEWVLVDHWQEAGLGYQLPDVLGWSANGQTLYFFDRIIPDGCPPPGGFQQDLRQVDLTTGEVEAIPVELGSGVSLSPDTTRVAFTDRTEAAVHIYEFESGGEQTIPFEAPDNPDGWFAGDFTWSPDGESLLINLQIGDTCFPVGNSIRRLDLQTGEARILVEQEELSVDIVEWSEPERALISIDGEEWWLETETGELERVDPEMAFENGSGGGDLPHSMKGYELYSWQADGEWNFTLITGTNRSKTVEEITTGDDQVTEDGWVKISVRGVEALKALLSRLPSGESVFWVGAAGVGPAPVEADAFALPPEDVVAEIREHCQGTLLDLTILEN